VLVRSAIDALDLWTKPEALFDKLFTVTLDPRYTPGAENIKANHAFSPISAKVQSIVETGYSTALADTLQRSRELKAKGTGSLGLVILSIGVYVPAEKQTVRIMVPCEINGKCWHLTYSTRNPDWQQTLYELIKEGDYEPNTVYF